MGAMGTFEPKPVSLLVSSTMLLLCRARLDILPSLIVGNLSSMNRALPFFCLGVRSPRARWAPSCENEGGKSSAEKIGRRARWRPRSGMDFPAASSDCLGWPGCGRAAAAVLKRRCFFRIGWQRFDRGVYAQ
jgi:hypothetical protein